MSEETVLRDDMTGEIGCVGRCYFGWAGAEYAIDLTDANRETLHKLLTPYLSVAHRVSGRRRTLRDVGASSKVVRSWANENGWTLSDKGRIPKEVRAAYIATRVRGETTEREDGW